MGKIQSGKLLFLIKKKCCKYLLGVNIIFKELNIISADAEPSSIDHERITTDTVHRRFRNSKFRHNKSVLEENEFNEDYYFCEMCKLKISASRGVPGLKEHFVTGHKYYEKCIYCSKPVYFYKHKGNLRVYHSC